MDEMVESLEKMQEGSPEWKEMVGKPFDLAKLQ